MSPERGGLDTSAVTQLGKVTEPRQLPDDSMITAVTLAELTIGPHVAEDAMETAAGLPSAAVGA